MLYKNLFTYLLLCELSHTYVITFNTYTYFYNFYYFTIIPYFYFFYILDILYNPLLFTYYSYYFFFHNIKHICIIFTSRPVLTIYSSDPKIFQRGLFDENTAPIKLPEILVSPLFKNPCSNPSDAKMKR